MGELEEQIEKITSVKWAELAKAMAERQSKDKMSESDMADVLRYVGIGGDGKRTSPEPAPLEPTIDDLVAREVRKLR